QKEADTMADHTPLAGRVVALWRYPIKSIPPVRVTLPEGMSLLSEQHDFTRLLSQALGREVVLSRATLSSPRFAQVWPALEGLASQPRVSEQAMPPFTFFDLAPLHLLTTATLARLAHLY